MTPDRNREQYEAELIAEALAEAARDAEREPSDDELRAQADAELVELDAADSPAMAMPPPAPTRHLPKPVPKPVPKPPAAKSCLNTPDYELNPDFYGYNHGRKQRGPYVTRRKLAAEAEAERQRRAAPPPPARPKAQPVAFPGRPACFVTPTRPPSVGDPNGVYRSTITSRPDPEPVRYPPPPPGYEVGFYHDKVTGERKADGWPGPANAGRQRNRETA